MERTTLAAARAAGVSVIYLQFGYKPDLSDAGGLESQNIRKQMAFRSRSATDSSFKIPGAGKLLTLSSLTRATSWCKSTV
jgi:hypothetical protein